MSIISETDLILPALYVMSQFPNGKISTTDLIEELRMLLKPSGDDLSNNQGRKDDKFSQKVRNLVSHKSLEKLGYAVFDDGYFEMTEEGKNYLKEAGGFIGNEDWVEEFEGEETINYQKTLEDEDEDIELSPDVDGQEILAVSKTLTIEKTYFSIYELKRKWERGLLILDPDFQRQNVWSFFQKSELIESILMNIPLPFIYLTEDKIGRLVVVDGRQRLTSLFDFLNGKFRLNRKLKILQGIRGKRFVDLEARQQGMVEDYQLTIHIIKPPFSDRVLIDIFDRVNRSGTTLNNQEIRNALYQGESTKLLKDLAESELFKEATDNSIKPDRMRDRYLILRFLAFYIWKTHYTESSSKGLVDYRGDTEEFLPKYMQVINKMSPQERESIVAAFTTAMGNAVSILGVNAFRLPNRRNDKKRPINMALFESLGYLLSQPIVTHKQEEFKGLYLELLEQEEFLNSFLSIDSTVKYRFNMMEGIKNKLTHA